MYRAIMEEVIRYLEKCHLNFDLLTQREKDRVIERSRSIAFMTKAHFADVADVRARSSTNLMSLNTSPSASAAAHKTRSGTLLSDISYSTFKDFTW